MALPSLAQLPLLNAILNACSTLFLLGGYYFIRTKRRGTHRVCMLSALTVSSLFLISYIVLHLHVGSVRFAGQGWVRILYFGILGTHTILAALVPPLAAITLFRALGKRYDKHRMLARWTFPIWLYVSVTGVLIYLFLYQFYPAAPM